MFKKKVNNKRMTILNNCVWIKIEFGGVICAWSGYGVGLKLFHQNMSEIA